MRRNPSKRFVAVMSDTRTRRQSCARVAGLCLQGSLIVAVGCAPKDGELAFPVGASEEASEEPFRQPSQRMRDLFHKLINYYDDVEWYQTRQQIFETDPEGREALVVLRDWLIGAEYSSVRTAADLLIWYEEKSIPVLIDLLDRDERVRLQNTANLIYPGARTFYGTGGIVDYDIDHLAVRAGWVLERITFEDFGFRQGMMSESTFLDASMRVQRVVPLSDLVVLKETPAAQIHEAAERARDWWRSNAPTWTRYQGILDALRSTNVNRQLEALYYVRHGDAPCNGLNPESFARDVLPLVEALAESGNPDVRIQAQHLLNDNDGWWWERKQPFRAPDE
jgi:hypothetical protein